MKLLLTIALPFVIIWTFFGEIYDGLKSGIWMGISHSKSNIKFYIMGMKR